MRKALERNLISTKQKKEMRFLFEKYFRLINGYIKSIGEKKDDNFLNEDVETYKSDAPELDNLLSNDLLTNDQ